MIPRDVSAPDHTRPEDVDRVRDHASSRGAKVHGVGEAHGNIRRSDMTDYFYVTSEAREGCEHAS